MKYLIDTSSLLALVRYYLPFDEKDFLSWIKKGFEDHNLQLISAVKEEIKRVSKGEVISRLTFLQEKKIIEKAIIIINPKIHRKIDEHWVVQNQKRRLNSEQFEQEKERMIESADFQLILSALENKENSTVVTEETMIANDNKLSKKIPVICKHEGIRCIALPKLLQELKLEITYQFGQNK